MKIKSFLLFILEILKILICSTLTFLFLGNNVLISTQNLDWQIKLYEYFLIFMIFATWAIFFVKNNNICKFLYLCLFVLFINIQNILPSVDNAFKLDLYFDNGYCYEGIKYNTRQGTITINKENCLKYDWKWDEKRKMCKIAR